MSKFSETLANRVLELEHELFYARAEVRRQRRRAETWQRRWMQASGVRPRAPWPGELRTEGPLSTSTAPAGTNSSGSTGGRRRSTA